MAQVTPDARRPWARRLSLMLRQRPGIVLALIVLVACTVVAAWLGWGSARADSIEIVRDETTPSVVDDGAGSSDEAPAASESHESSTDADGFGVDDAGDGQVAPVSPTEVVVDVTGAVRRPAVVRLAAGSRVGDALEAVGGVTDDADMSAINRAAMLVDGQKVHVPREGEQVATSSEAATQPDGTTGEARININTADAAELDTLPGVGPSTAQAIVKDREEQGPFTSVEDIMRVSGIGEKKFENLKDLICV